MSLFADYFVGQPFCAVFQKLSGSENFMIKWGEYQDFPSKNFSLTVPKKFVGQPCCAVIRIFPVAKKFMDKRGGGDYQDFPSKNFSLIVPNVS